MCMWFLRSTLHTRIYYLDALDHGAVARLEQVQAQNVPRAPHSSVHECWEVVGEGGKLVYHVLYGVVYGVIIVGVRNGVLEKGQELGLLGVIAYNDPIKDE